jgi:hypothetical protein
MFELPILELLTPLSMKKLALTVALICIFLFSFGQGCVAIRNLTGFGQFASLGYGQTDAKWMMNIDTRFFNANRDYTGTTSNDDGIYLGSSTVNFTLSRILENGWLVSLDVPLAYNTASVPWPGGRHTVSTFGLSDIRFTVYKWLMKTNETRRWNLQTGLGLKLPTGNYKAQDYGYLNPNDPNSKALVTLQPSSQLGDGGTGITTELNGYYALGGKVTAYGNLFYMFSPVDQNGVGNGQHTAAQIQATYDVNSVPDAYTMRLGANTTFNHFVWSLGLRHEGTPGHDVFGASHGLRRAGYIYSVETGVSYKLTKGFLYAFYTLPFSQGTVQSDPDKVYTSLPDPDLKDPQGNPTPKPAGDYFISGGHFNNGMFFFGYAFMF